MSLVQRLSEQLQQSLDPNFKVTNVEAVLEIIKKLEGIPITKEQLETTRLAKFINGLRRQTTDDNLARRSKNLLRKWRDSVMPTLAPNTQQPPQPQITNIASNSGSYFVNNHNSSIQQNGVSALAQPPGSGSQLRHPPKQQQQQQQQLQQPLPILTISSASSSPLMPQQLLPQPGFANINRPYNGKSLVDNNNQQSQFSNQQQQQQQPVNLTMHGSNYVGDAGVAASALLKQRQNQPMNCDTNSTNSFLMSNNTTSDLSDNSQQCGSTSAITPSRRNKSNKKEKEKKNKKASKEVSDNNLQPMNTFGGVISSGLQKPQQLNNNRLMNDDSGHTFFDSGDANISNNVNNSKSGAAPAKLGASRSLQQPFLLNGDSLSSSQSISNFSFGGGSRSNAPPRSVADNDNLSFSGHFSKIKSNTMPATQSLFPALNTAPTTTAISLVDDDDVVLINSSRSHSPFMPVMTPTVIMTSTNPTPLELLVKESMTPVATPVPISVPEAKVPKKRGRKKGSKGIDSQLHLQNSLSHPSTSAGTGGSEINSYLEMKHKIESMQPKTKKLKTTQELYAELQNKSKAASASTSTQVSPSSSSEQSMSTAVDSVASRMATPDPTSQDVEPSTSRGTVRRNNALTSIKQEKQEDETPAVPVKSEPLPKGNIEDEINYLMTQLPPIDFHGAFDVDENTIRAEEIEKCLCSMRIIEPEIVPTVELVNEEDVTVSVTIPQPKPTNNVAVKIGKIEPEKPRPKPLKQIKSIFDLDYDDDNDPIHDFRNSTAQPDSPVAEEKEAPIQFKISQPAFQPEIKSEVPLSLPPSEPVPSEPAPMLAPVIQVEYDIDPDCPAMKKFETNPQQITNYHLDALHHRFLSNVNGNWSNAPVPATIPDATIIKQESDNHGPTNQQSTDSTETRSEDKLFDRVVPLYNFLHYEPIPKIHANELKPTDYRTVEMKLLIRDGIYQKQREEAEIKSKKRQKAVRREARKTNVTGNEKLLQQKRKLDADDDDHESWESASKRIKLDEQKISGVNDDDESSKESNVEQANDDNQKQKQQNESSDSDNPEENNKNGDGDVKVKDKHEVKRRKLKKIQEDITWSSFMDPNYEFVYTNDQQTGDQKSSSSNAENNIEVAVPLKSNLNLSISDVNTNNGSDCGNNVRKNQSMLMMTIDDDVDIRNENFFNNKLASSYHQRDFEFSANSDSLRVNENGNLNFSHQDGYSNNNKNMNNNINQLCEIYRNNNSDNGTIDQTINTNLSQVEVKPQNKPDIRMLVTGVQHCETYIPLSSIELPRDIVELEELEKNLPLELSDFNNHLLHSFEETDHEMQSPSKPGVSSDANEVKVKAEKPFSEWHEVSNVQSYNDEVITILPYVVID